ncbi:hypothetical protein [Pseudonocardia sp.]|uniref:hypothetical protein n=1 Tax=Pseudonocardia sp. TaxID=60912 RepID=UPI003D12AAA1
MSDGIGEQATRELLAEFGGRVDAADVRAEVRRALRELDGQTPRGGVTELVHRLVRIRLLDRLDPDRLDPGPGTTEPDRPDHREHLGTPHPVDDGKLGTGAQREREQTGAGGPVDGP